VEYAGLSASGLLSICAVLSEEKVLVAVSHNNAPYRKTEIEILIITTTYVF